MKKRLSSIYKKIIEYVLTNRLFLSYVIISITGTIFFRINILNSFASPLPFFADLGVILIFGSLGYFIKSKNQFKHLFLLLCIFSLTEIVNAIYYVFFTSFASFGDLATLSQVETVGGSVFEKLKIAYLIYAFGPVIFYFIHKKLLSSSYYNIMEKIEKNKKMALHTFEIGFLLIILTFSFATKKDYSRLTKLWNREYVVKRFGVLLYQGNDLIQSLRPRFSSLIGYEDAKKIFDEHFNSEESKEYTNKNKYTKILEGKNVVYVHMESMQNFLMELKFNNQEVTPNLNKIAKEGMFFSNFYPEVSTGTSADTEFTSLSSLMPSATGTVFVGYYNRNYITLPKLLSENGYHTFSMHGNYSSMWNRNKAHPSLGYKELIFREEYTFTEEDVINLGINDKLFFKQSVEKLERIEEENSNYMGTIITLSNHSPFTFKDKYGYFDLTTTHEIVKNDGQKEIVTSNYLDNTAVGNFIRSAHYADSALGDFIKYLKESEYFNDTLFVFYGDHDAKLSRREMNYLYNYNYETGGIYEENDARHSGYDQFSHELNKKTPLIFWTKNKDLQRYFKGEVKYFMGMIDLQPTLLNMLGLKNEYALGHDIFSIKDNNIIPFPNGNFLTKVLYYNNSTGTFKVNNNKAIIDDDYISTRKEKVEKLLDISNSIIVYDLLNKKEDKNE